MEYFIVFYLFLTHWISAQLHNIGSTLGTGSTLGSMLCGNMFSLLHNIGVTSIFVPMWFHSLGFPGTLQWSTSMDMDKLWEGWRTWSYEVERTSIPGSILLSSMYNVKLSAETFQNKNRQNSFNQHQKHLPFKFSTRLVQWSPKNKLENGPTVDLAQLSARDQFA